MPPFFLKRHWTALFVSTGAQCSEAARVERTQVEREGEVVAPSAALSDNAVDAEGRAPRCANRFVCRSRRW